MDTGRDELLAFSDAFFFMLGDFSPVVSREHLPPEGAATIAYVAGDWGPHARLKLESTRGTIAV
jgi:hypothetical protein